jgi:uncharacterized protein YciI
VDVDTYAFVLLRRPPDATPMSDDEADALQLEHLAHLQAMRDRGKLVAAGPFRDQVDDSLRGLCFYATSVEEARELASQDPAVRRGRLAVDVMTWFTRKGSVQFLPE